MRRVDVLERPTQTVAAAPRTRFSRSTKLAVGIVLGVVVLNLIGFSGLWVTNVAKASRAITNDLDLHVARLTTLLHSTDIFDEAMLPQWQTELNAASADLQKLNGLLPLGGNIGTRDITRMHHGIQMANDFCQALQNLFGGIGIVEPGLRAFLYSLLKSPGIAQGSTVVPMTLHDINNAQALIRNSNNAWELVEQERQILGNAPLSDAFGISATPINRFVNYINQTFPNYAKAFPAISALLDHFHILTGILRPGHLLLALADPDQLRPGGGAIGAYADVRTNGGKVTNRLQFQDISRLDCPTICAQNAVPPQYAWYTPQDGMWGVRDSELDPNFQQSGMQIYNLYLAETGEAVDGIMVFTPALLQQILQIMGPVVVRSLHVTVSVKNVAQAMYREHQKALALSPQIAGAAIPTYDELFANAIFDTLAHATNSQLRQIGTALLHDLTTKDVQLFSIYERVETQLQSLGADGSLNAPYDDSLAVVDTNMGRNFTSAGVTERISDRITLDQAHMATHALTVTYNYPSPATLGSSSGVYDDLVQVLVPAQLAARTISGACKQIAITFTGSTDLACRLKLEPGASVSLRFSWAVPLSLQNHIYRLLVQRQAGAEQNYSITLIAAKGGHLTPVSADARLVKGVVTWSRAPLLNDVDLSVIVM